jgi:hypothetical protein
VAVLAVGADLADADLVAHNLDGLFAAERTPERDRFVVTLIFFNEKVALAGKRTRDLLIFV